MKDLLHGSRLSFEDAIDIYRNEDLLLTAARADAARRSLHPDGTVTYIIDRNINYTNICCSGCLFCAFFRPKGHPDAYIITREEITSKIEGTLALGGTQILLQGGLHPDLGLDYFEGLFRFIKENFPIHIHGLSPPEIHYLAAKETLSYKETLIRLKNAGLDSIPGGGAEILVDRIRAQVSPRKCSASAWLKVMETAHELGIRSTATMMFGHLESDEERIIHLFKIRDLQDRTGGFTAFIPWTFQPENTRLRLNKLTSVQYLKMLAVSRLVLDNIPNIQASWVTQGPKIGQVALHFGANDLGSTMIEENVVSAAGTSFNLRIDEIVRLIETAGFRPVQRDTLYRPVLKDKS